MRAFECARARLNARAAGPSRHASRVGVQASRTPVNLLPNEQGLGMTAAQEAAVNVTAAQQAITTGGSMGGGSGDQ